MSYVNNNAAFTSSTDLHFWCFLYASEIKLKCCPQPAPVPTASKTTGTGKTETAVLIYTQAPTAEVSDIRNVHFQVLFSVNNLGTRKPIIQLMN